METLLFRDLRFPLAIATLFAVGALWWGLSLSTPPSDRRDDNLDLGLNAPGGPQGWQPSEEFKGKTKNGGRAPRGARGK
ncbi:MAG TPA: hypothetical protein VFQ67_08020 [Allosphingosinicella sp.]|jgi:hypothetical protein|nr:hypothetical protein [Allosphingosinicella sp.]